MVVMWVPNLFVKMTKYMNEVFVEKATFFVKEA